MKRSFYLVLSILLLSLAAGAQSNATMDSYLKARSVLDRSIAAYGGLQELRAIENVSLKVEGDSVHRNQSKKAFASDRTPLKAEYIIDVKNTRYRQRMDGHYPGGFDWVNGFVIIKTEAVTWDELRGMFNTVPTVPASSFRRRIRIVPQLMVLNALDRSSRLRYLGTASFDGRPHSVISYSNEDGLEISLYIDDKTGLLSKNEYLFTDPFSGDTVSEMVYAGYKQENGRMVPGGRRDLLSGELVSDVKISEMRFNSALTDESFKLPAGLKAATPPPAEQPFTKYGDNVYTVNAGGYNVLAVGFQDHVFVMEAPGGDGTSRQAIAEIKKLFPDKPIRFLAVTHHHDDHAGGIRTYIAGGATLLGMPGERAFFEKVAKSKFTIDPDSLTLNPQPLNIDLIKEGKRTLTDGTTTVELIDIGPGGHTDEMLVAYLPAQKLLFQGDLLNRPANNDPPTINDTTVHFSRWLDSSSLDVERIIGVHGPPSSLEELRKGVAEKTNNRAQADVLPRREVAITFDDLPASHGDLARMRESNEKLLHTIKANNIPAIGFVNEAKLAVEGETAARTALLKMWVDAGLDLGNHSYSHIQIDNATLKQYQDDIVRGETVTRRLLWEKNKQLRYYRHTQLRTGPTPAFREGLNKFLAGRGYTIAPVTIDNQEWVFAGAYAGAKVRGDEAEMKKIGDAYVRYMDETFGFFEKLSRDFLGYEVKQTLLLHVNDLNADYFDELVGMMKKRGYNFISLDEALKDKAYTLPEAQSTRGLSWLHRWMLAKGLPIREEPREPAWVGELHASYMRARQNN